MTRQELLERYSGIVDLTSKQFESLLRDLMLISNDSNLNSQILCHGAGAKGIQNLSDILNGSGLRIIRTDPDSNNEVGSGLLSTNVCFNNSITNRVDIEEAFDYKYNYSDAKGNFYTIVSAIPLAIEDIPLGRIIKQTKVKNCVLDDLEIKNIPREFILGVLISDGTSYVSKFSLNPNFFMLSKENYKNAYNSVLEIFKNSYYGSVSEYYSMLNSTMQMMLKRKELGMPYLSLLKEYQQEALNLYDKMRKDKKDSIIKNDNRL